MEQNNAPHTGTQNSQPLGLRFQREIVTDRCCAPAASYVIFSAEQMAPGDKVHCMYPKEIDFHSLPKFTWP
jgi:hypothetical protein